MTRYSFLAILAAAIVTVSLLIACGSDPGPNKPVVLKPTGTLDEIFVNVCRKGLSDSDYVYDDCSDSAADAACREFHFDSSTTHVCRQYECNGVTKTFMISVVCWKADTSASPALPNSLVDSVRPITGTDR